MQALDLSGIAYWIYLDFQADDPRLDPQAIFGIFQTKVKITTNYHFACRTVKGVPPTINSPKEG